MGREEETLKGHGVIEVRTACFWKPLIARGTNSGTSLSDAKLPNLRDRLLPPAD